MASYTPNLNLLMKDPVADGADTFNIETMLNQNWEKIDRQVLLAMAAAAAYNAGTTYRKGDFCSRGGLLHRANQDIAQPEAWTAGHWTDISITDVIRGLTAADVGAAPGGVGFGDAIQEIVTASAEESYETYCAKVDAVLDAMPDKTAKLVRAYPPAVYGNAGTTISLLYKSDANYAVLSNIGSADAGLCGWRMFKLRHPSSSSPAVWMPFEWEHPPMKLGAEYRTAERYNGKPVYMMALDFTGPLANSDGVQVMISDMPKAATKVIWSNVVIENTASGERAQLPSVDETGKVTAYVYTRAEEGYDGLILGIMSTTDMSGWTAPVFVVKYIKTTD